MCSRLRTPLRETTMTKFDSLTDRAIETLANRYAARLKDEVDEINRNRETEDGPQTDGGKLTVKGWFECLEESDEELDLITELMNRIRAKVSTK